jgi:hypothetical protein
VVDQTRAGKKVDPSSPVPAVGTGLDLFSEPARADFADEA